MGIASDFLFPLRQDIKVSLQITLLPVAKRRMFSNLMQGSRQWCEVNPNLGPVLYLGSKLPLAPDTKTFSRHPYGSGDGLTLVIRKQNLPTTS